MTDKAIAMNPATMNGEARNFRIRFVRRDLVLCFFVDLFRCVKVSFP